ncbi:MAG: Unknown protein [uncultured Sulfurovum sp.]|uniref:Uncharacterized protein n=1 Tax=uncultured Sulfurovum sp. TaxID=269237 RepID=A0A6S6TSR8_9BACT|nr:MAG: Unknown protein [uncultured Sulfurovum sp.]
MRELLLVSISALLGYIVFSAFSTSETPSEAFQKIIDQPHENRQVNHDLAVNNVHNKHEEELIALENKHKLEELQVYGEIKRYNKENETKIELKKLDNELNHKLAVLKIDSEDKDKNKDNGTLIILALLLFLLFFIYLKYKKQLNEIELQRKEKYEEMMAKKEYAEKILAYMSQGNLSFETEKKLLTILDELNGKIIEHRDKNDMYHPNPDIIQLSNINKVKKS